eukprot:TRINITY_DN21386_c0_g1_i1.p1 TRINITY_DN21386_c0_g1~~TRINITY_DN21386_c0_g1_i1.p1  ORF type:complete len:711 (+),score=235.00 TRINITY_DN21386_c0_g1_i1:94-2226(+)
MPQRAAGAAARVAALRAKFSKAGIDAYLVLTADPHQSEYVAPYFERRHWLSGFTGSCGTALVTKDKALLWTDSRYFLQAERELDSAVWQLMKMREKDVPTLGEWCTSELADGTRIGFDADCVSACGFERLEKQFKTGKRKVELKAVTGNLVDDIWGAERPSLASERIRVHDIKFAGMSVEEKLDKVAADLKKQEADAVVLSALDDVAWLFNLRGADQAHTPIFFSYAVVLSDGTATLLVDSSRFEPGVREHLGSRVAVRPYGGLHEVLRGLSGRVLYDEALTSYGAKRTLDQRPTGRVAAATSHVQILKAVKNEVEMQGMRECHRRDGIALCRYLMWLEQQVRDGQKITEWDGSQKLLEFRKAQEHFLMASFPTISSSGPNAASCHYEPAAEDSRDITASEIYLVDSGGQYHDGTTDVTRTVHFGIPTAREREAYTLVLKGVIALAEIVCPDDVRGYQIDSFARMALWQFGLDYGHGTGHGVGSCLGVHEGPFLIAGGHSEQLKTLQCGCVTSNEPGFYLAGEFGIRIENLQCAVARSTKYSVGGKKFIGFEQLTVVPLDAKLIDPGLLTPAEVRWVDNYHNTVRESLGPLVCDDAALSRWIHDRCAPLHVQKRRVAAQEAAMRAEAERKQRMLNASMSAMKAELARLEAQKQSRASGAKRPRVSGGPEAAAATAPAAAAPKRERGEDGASPDAKRAREEGAAKSPEKAQ